MRAINRRFYDRYATEFSATREAPWPGWVRAIEQAPVIADAPVAVLDVGCGNGRFGAYLAKRWQHSFHYLGLDGCAALLQAADRKLETAGKASDRPMAGRTTYDLRRLDVLDPDFDSSLDGRRFDWIALFGVLHHIPGTRARRVLLERLGALLAPGGVLAASIWRLDQSPRFDRLVVPWESLNRDRTREGLEPLDLHALEKGDTLLSWGGETAHPRYCHFPTDEEIESWVAAPGVSLADRFEADGRSGRDNLYLVWRG